MFTEVLAKIEQVKSYLYVVGEQYRELWGEDDWYRLLVKLGLA